MRADAHRNLLAYPPVLVDVLLLQIFIEAAINRMSHLPESQFTQSNEIPTAKEVLERLFRSIERINIAALHPRLQRFRREIGHYDFVGASQDPIRNSFPNLNSGNTLHRRIHALEMLNVHRG